jgi:small subunit ribosomal protein S1
MELEGGNMSGNQDELMPGLPGEQPDQTGDQEDYEHLLEDYSHYAPPSEGDVLQGIVVGFTAKYAMVDIGYKSEGVVPLSELAQADGTVSVGVGDTVDVMVDRAASQAEGYLVLSHHRAARLRYWDNIEDAHRQGLLVSGRVIGRTKGGLEVDVGVPAFMPGSQVDTRPFSNPDALVGTDIAVKILKLNRRRGNVVVSRKAALEEEGALRKAETLAKIEEGAVVTGVVKNLTAYGVFVDLGGIDGLLHVSDISHGRVGHPSEVLHAGDEVTVKVLKFDRQRERISLGMKQVTPDPWSVASARYLAGARVIGRVVSVTDYGAFVELEPGVEGLIHISEMTWSRRMKHPGKVCRIGDQVEAVVLEVHTDQHRVSLGIKQLEADPWTTVAERYSVGSLVEGRVRKLSDFGAFVEIEEGIDGLVHISDLTWTKRLKHPSEAVRKGQVIQAVILNIDPSARRLSLGVKQLQPDAWETFFHSHNPGDIVRGRVTRAAAFGVFVELAPGVEGLCHHTEIPSSPGRGKDEPALPIGTETDFKIVKMAEAEKKIGLSVNAVVEDEELSRLEDYHRQAAAATMTIEEAMRRKRR